LKFLSAEKEFGNIEYKYSLIGKKDDNTRLEELASQMKFRLYEGQGEALYYVGVSDDGNPKGIPSDDLDESMLTLKKIAVIADSRITILRRVQGEEGEVAEIIIRQEKKPDELPVDIRIASIGNVDAGKSTLIGVLFKGDLDNGRGSARSSVFRYLHELESGRTSSVGITVIGFDINENIVNHNKIHPPTDIELLEQSIKTISFHDLAGHEKYLKTTIYGLTGLLPNYAMLIVSANQGVLQMTKEHLGLVVALKIPFFVVLTKIDITPHERTIRTIQELKKLLKIPGVSKVPLMVKDKEDPIVAALNIEKSSIVPIFQVSAVNGDGMPNLIKFLNLIKAPQNKSLQRESVFRAYIDDIFMVSGVGTVVACMIYSGSSSPNDKLWLGPFDDGSFIEVRIKSIHYKRVNASIVVAGQNATFAIAKVKRDQVRKGMVLLGTQVEKSAAFEFEAEIYVLYHSTTIRIGYTPVIHCRSIRQSAKMIKINQEQLRTGDRANVRFKFMYKPEYIQIGQRIVFREGRTKGIGIINNIF